MDQNYFNYCLEKFKDLPDPVRGFLNSPDTAVIIREIEIDHEVSLSFLIVLVAIDELSFEDIPSYLEKKHQIDKSRGELIAAEIIDRVFGPLLNQEDLSDEAVINDILGEQALTLPLIDRPLEERRQYILDIFEEELVPTLQASNSELKELNLTIFKTFNDDLNLEDQVESLLYKNQEKLTTKSIILDGHPAAPTVANWLKDFIKIYGSSLFSEISLAEYLVKASNLKKLASAEKELVRKLLKLYRNLVFFPESMDGILLENWELFPLDVAANDSLTETNKLLRTATSALVEKESRPASVSAETATTVAPVNEKGQLIQNLQKSLVKYSVSSLEYKALQQEINRLKRED
ncbi:MAG: hypothetical protein JST_000118 [Candidatus Parcubacteria bacterium]|jgi:hypothetical protein|nr:MAG: hypothetical protein JST_1020 [Candidatus Parcubacteria bacterium]